MKTPLSLNLKWGGGASNSFCGAFFLHQRPFKKGSFWLGFIPKWVIVKYNLNSTKSNMRVVKRTENSLSKHNRGTCLLQLFQSEHNFVKMMKFGYLFLWRKENGGMIFVAAAITWHQREVAPAGRPWTQLITFIKENNSKRNEPSLKQILRNSEKKRKSQNTAFPHLCLVLLELHPHLLAVHVQWLLPVLFWQFPFNSTARPTTALHVSGQWGWLLL